MDAIIYTSNTGTTEQYARLLGEATGLPVYPLARADEVREGAEILYLGWLMASGVRGYKKAAKRFRVKAVCGVGMRKSGTQIEEVRKANAIADLPVFTLQGGLDMQKLRGVNKLMMTVVRKSTVKELSEKAERTAEEDDTLHMFLHGGNRVSMDNLAPVLEWYRAQ